MIKNKDLDKNKGIYRQYDSGPITLISAYPKVLQILNGKIPIPEVVEIFPTNFCNFHCPHCRFEGYHGNSNSYLRMSFFKKLLKEISRKDIKAIEISGGGEPLMHPQIEAIFKEILDGEFRVGLITNGYKFINSKKLQYLALKTCNWIRFSVDAFTDDTFKSVHGKNNISYKELKKTILELIELRKDKWPNIEIKILVSKLNAHECELAINEAISMNVDCLQFKFLGRHAYALSDKEVIKVTKTIQKLIEKNKNKSINIELTPAYRGKRSYQKCLMTFLHPIIDWDGEIYVCAFFEHRKKSHSIGNIHKGGFFKYWDSPYHKKIFDSIDPATCVPKCPMLRYNPVIDFIKTDSYRFPFV